MRVTYTAQELFEHIQSYNTVHFSSYQDEENLMSAIINSSEFKLIKRKTVFSIIAEVSLSSKSKVKNVLCGITGNEFCCEVADCDWYEVIEIKHGGGEAGIELILKNFRRDAYV